MRDVENALTGSCTRDAVMIAASCATIATLVPVALHQVGKLKHLPDPPSGVFDSDGITESGAAHPLGIPDGVLGLVSFGTTLGLIFAARQSRPARIALGGKLLFDAGFAGFNLVRQVVQFRRLCSWCTGTAVAAITTAAAGKIVVADAVSEAVAAIDAL